MLNPPNGLREAAPRNPGLTSPVAGAATRLGGRTAGFRLFDSWPNPGGTIFGGGALLGRCADGITSSRIARRPNSVRKWLDENENFHVDPPSYFFAPEPRFQTAQREPFLGPRLAFSFFVNLLLPKENRVQTLRLRPMTDVSRKPERQPYPAPLSAWPSPQNVFLLATAPPKGRPVVEPPPCRLRPCAARSVHRPARRPPATLRASMSQASSSSAAASNPSNPESHDGFMSLNLFQKHTCEWRVRQDLLSRPTPSPPAVIAATHGLKSRPFSAPWPFVSWNRRNRGSSRFRPGADDVRLARGLRLHRRFVSLISAMAPVSACLPIQRSADCSIATT